MERRSATIKAKTGLHARPATELIKFVKQYKSKVEIVWGSKTGNCGSILSIMGLGIPCGEEVVIQTTGEDEVKAAEEVAAFINNLED